MAHAGAAAPVETASHARAEFGLILLLGALTAFAAMSLDLYLPGLPAIGRDLHATVAEAQLTVATFYIGMALGQLVYGPLSDRVGRRGPLLVGVSVYVAASVGCALAPTIHMLIGLRLLQALGGCTGTVLARAVVRDRFDPQKTAQIFSTLMLVMGLAPIMAPLAGGYILTIATWRALFWVLAGFGLLCGLGVLFGLKESRSAAVAAHARAESPLRSYAELLGEPRLIGYVLYGACTSSALFTYIATGPDLLINTYHIRPQDFGWVFGTNAAGLIAASQINRRWLQRQSYDVILRRTNLAGIGFAVLLALGAATGFGGRWGVLVPLFFVIAGMGFNQANSLAGALAVDPRRAGSTAALAGAASFGCGSIAAAVAGALHDGTPRPMAFVILAVLLLAAAALYGLAHRGQGDQGRGPPSTTRPATAP